MHLDLTKSEVTDSLLGSENMDNIKLLNVQSLDSHKRLEYLIRKVADFELIWGSYGDNGWLLLSDENGRRITPFWPEKEFVNEYNITHKYDYFAKKIDLYYFLDNWINELAKDKIDIVVFPVKEKESIIISPLQLKALIENELEQYE